MMPELPIRDMPAAFLASAQKQAHFLVSEMTE